MTVWLIPGMIGLLAGLLLHWAGFSRAAGLRLTLGLRRSLALRSALTALGWGLVFTALLCWLAVIDVDTIEVLPLSLGALTGGALLGIAAGLCGFTPMTAFAGLGGGNALEALCVLAGCAAGGLLHPALSARLAPLHEASPYAAATLFKVTLDEPFLLDGGFLGLGCLGLVLAEIGLCIPSPKPVLIPDEEIATQAEALSAAEAAVPPAPEDTPADTFIALLEGEEPLAIDTILDEEPPAADALPDEDDPIQDEESPAVDTPPDEELPAIDAMQDEEPPELPPPEKTD